MASDRGLAADPSKSALHIRGAHCWAGKKHQIMLRERDIVCKRCWATLEYALSSKPGDDAAKAT